MILYHGSHKLLKILKPHISSNRRSAVYLSPDKTFALCYAGLQWNDNILMQGYYNGQLYIRELFKDIIEILFNRSGYLYVVDTDLIDNEFTYPDTSIGRSGHELWTFKSIEKFKTIFIGNVLEELKKSNIKIYYCDN